MVIPQDIGEQEGPISPIHPTKHSVFNLPPEACPSVAILNNIPSLTSNVIESTGQLKNEVFHWLTNYSDFNIANYNEILLVRYVATIDPSPKLYKGDCIVVNFRHPQLSRNLLAQVIFRSPHHGSVKILLLGFFLQTSLFQPTSPAFWHQTSDSSMPIVNVLVSNGFQPSMDLEQLERKQMSVVPFHKATTPTINIDKCTSATYAADMYSISVLRASLRTWWMRIHSQGLRIRADPQSLRVVRQPYYKFTALTVVNLHCPQ